MNKTSPIQKIVLLGNYPPRQCGIATFTADTYRAITEGGNVECFVFNVSDEPGGYDTAPEVVLEIPQDNNGAYESAAEYAHSIGAQLALIQHEFGIFGARAGQNVLTFVEALDIPAIVQLHTILEAPNPEQKYVMAELNRLAARFVVMSERGRKMLDEIYGIDPARVDVIPHGIPDSYFGDPSFFKDQFGLSTNKVILTFGLLSPNKGIEYMIEAMPTIVDRHPKAKYIVLGATHPHILRQVGEEYRESLTALAEELGVGENVIFDNRYVDNELLLNYLGACDVYVTPYLHKQQITSGTLAYAYGSGKAVVSTPYWHAEELLANDKGELVPFRDPEELADAVCRLLDDDVYRNRIRKAAYLEGREFVWSKIGERLAQTFEKAVEKSVRRTREEFEVLAPPITTPSLHHILRMTDGVGLFQHARYTFPYYAEGYCTDDNVRALMVMAQLGRTELGETADEIEALASRYAAFTEYAHNSETSSFRNFMHFNRNWLEDSGSADCQGRCIYAAGVVVNMAPWPDLRQWAAELYMRSVADILQLDSLRAWANAMLGIHAFCQRFPGHKKSLSIMKTLAQRIMSQYKIASSENWNWYESILAYDNARLPDAMIAAGDVLGNKNYLAVGFETLEWLMEQQSAPEGWFRPIGSNGFYRKGKSRAEFDQQPLEAWASVAACRRAFELTGAKRWRDEAYRAFAWFSGDNDLGQSLIDPETGACGDGLHADRVNLNCGAESTLAYLGSVAEMRAMMADSVSSLIYRSVEQQGG